MTGSSFDVICGDCVDVMKGLADKEFALCLTDPPYNVRCGYDLYADDVTKDEYLRFSMNWFEEARRIADAVMFTPGNANLRMWITEIEYPKEIVMLYLPNQSSASFSGGFSHWEPVLCYGKIRLRKTAIKGNVAYQRDVGDKHPCPKNVKIWSDVLENMYPQPDSVIDPFLGSGTTAVVSRNAKVDRFIGVDMSEEYCDLARGRIGAVTVHDWW